MTSSGTVAGVSFTGMAMRSDSCATGTATIGGIGTFEAHSYVYDTCDSQTGVTELVGGSYLVYMLERMP